MISVENFVPCGTLNLTIYDELKSESFRAKKKKSKKKTSEERLIFFYRCKSGNFDCIKNVLKEDLKL